MSKNTKIQWTDHTFNPWMGCAKVSPGCANCYAEVSTPSRARGIKWGKGQPRQRTSDSNWKEPLRWNKQAIGKARPRVFCASLADWLDDEVPIEWLADLLNLIHETPNLDWLLLTKRPENFFKRVGQAGNDAPNRLSAVQRFAHGWWSGNRIPQNIWIGTTVEDQQRADERIPHLLNIPAKVRFLSVEPMLGLIDLTSHLLRGGLHWAIFGGESGKNARPCDVSWIRVAGTQCRLYHVAPFVKQLGSAAGVKHPKGGDPEEWPEDLRVREFPNV